MGESLLYRTKHTQSRWGLSPRRPACIQNQGRESRCVPAAALVAQGRLEAGRAVWASPVASLASLLSSTGKHQTVLLSPILGCSEACKDSC